MPASAGERPGAGTRPPGVSIAAAMLLGTRQINLPPAAGTVGSWSSTWKKPLRCSIDPKNRSAWAGCEPAISTAATPQSWSRSAGSDIFLDPRECLRGLDSAAILGQKPATSVPT